jgi:hypothetical protein
MSESFVPPERVASAARRGLRLREKVKAGTDVGVARARDLSNRRPVSLETIGRMVSFFARHGAQKPANIGTDASPTPWLVAWLLWGGDAGREWSEGVWRRKGDEQQASRMGLARRGAAQAWSVDDPPAAPPSALVHNPGGLHLGRAFRVLTAGETVRDGTTGEALGNFDAATLAEFVRVFEARCSRGEGAPRIDYNHGPSRGMDPTLFGAVVSAYVADDGKRGVGLYVVPGYTDHGRDFVAQHATPGGGSLLSNSPEFAVGPAYSRSGGAPDEQGDYLGGAELLGVALTGSPQQSEGIIDAVRLARDGHSTAFAAGEVSYMDPEQEAGEAGNDRIGALEATVAQLAAAVGKLGEGMAAIVAKLENDGEAIVEMSADAAKAAVEDVTAEAVEEVRAAAEQQMAQLSDDEAAEVEVEMGEMSLALSRRGTPNARRQKAWARKGELARAKVAGRQVVALSRQVQALEARALDAECDAEIGRLKVQGLKPSEEATARAYWHAKQRDAQAWSKGNPGVLHPFDKLTADIKARSAMVPRGVLGVQGDDVVSPVSVAGVKAWAKANGVDFDSNPGIAFSAWERATGHSTKEIKQ